MKKFTKILLSILCAAVIALPVFAACAPKEPEVVDYVSQVQLDLSSTTAKQEVKVRLYVDGDTTHFDPVQSTITANHDFSSTRGYIKARYLAIDTPESTGKIEKWGKTASNFTRGKLEAASEPGGSIIVESDDGNWNVDSTGSRYLLWIWYRLPNETEYRNLNIEILQEGLAKASNTANNRYGKEAYAALMQAQRLELYVFSPESTVDPNFYTGQSLPVSLKYLRTHLEDYKDVAVRVDGYVIAQVGSYVYLQDIEKEDEGNEDPLYYGMYVYLGQSTVPILEMGAHVSVVALVQYYESGNSYQLSGIEYSEFSEPKLGNTKLLDNDYHAPVFTERTAKNITSGKVKVQYEGEEEIELDYGEAIMSTAVQLSHLKVVEATMTDDDESASHGAFTLTCEQTNSDGTKSRITVRTDAFKDENGKLIDKESFYLNKTITVRGIIALFKGNYQVRLYHLDYLEFE